MLVVDWQEGASGIGADNNAKITGEDMDEFITVSHINRSRIHCIGHGLGQLQKVFPVLVNYY